MSIDHILESAGTSVEDLDLAVSTYQHLIDQGLGQVSLDSFDTEAHATTIEQLASRLAAIYSMVEPMLNEEGPQSLLARAIVGEIAPDPLTATALVRARYGSTNGADTPGVLLSERPLYGHPLLRHVIRGFFDHANRTLNVTAYIVDPSAGTIHPILEHERPGQAAVRVSQRTRTAVDELTA